jgi:hypothetical protein
MPLTAVSRSAASPALDQRFLTRAQLRDRCVDIAKNETFPVEVVLLQSRQLPPARVTEVRIPSSGGASFYSARTCARKSGDSGAEPGRRPAFLLYFQEDFGHSLERRTAA